LEEWTQGDVISWLKARGMPSLVPSFLAEKLDGAKLASSLFREISRVVRGEQNEIDKLPEAHRILIERYHLNQRVKGDARRALVTDNLPDGFRSSGSAVPVLEWGMLRNVPWDSRSVSKQEYMPVGERSQWEFEQDFWEPSAKVAYDYFDLPWHVYPFWRVGIELRRILQKSNLAISVLARLSDHYNHDVKRIGVSKDLLPMPLPELSDEEEVDDIIMMYDDPDAVSTVNFVQDCWATGSESWIFVMVAVLNFLHTGKDPRLRDLGVCVDTLNVEQKVALARMYHQIQLFIGYEPPVEHFKSDFSWYNVLKMVSVDYSGEEIHPAQMMTWKQVKPALPAPGKAGAVRLLDICEGMMAEAMKDPSLLLKPECEWKPPRKAVKANWATPDEWRKIVAGCAELGVFRFLKRSDLLHVSGVPVVHNCLGVGKGKFLDDGSEVLRMVFNLDITNSMLRLIIADIRSLSYPGQWQSVQMLDPQLDDGEEFVFAFSSADLTCAYFCFATERAWDKYLAFEGPVTGNDVKHVFPDLADELELFPCSAVLPMGFNSASSIMQYVHVRMATMNKPRGAGLSIYRQMRVDRPLPVRVKQETDALCDMLWEVFQDNFGETERMSVQSVFDLIGTLSPELADMQETYLVWGASQAEKKTLERVLDAETLGFVRDGVAGVQIGTQKATMTLVGLTAFVIRHEEATLKTLQVLGGRWCRQVQVRRELSSCLDGLWRVMSQHLSQRNNHRGRKWMEAIPVTPALREDLFLLMCSLPFQVMDLRLRTDPIVTASDASEQGCGACRTKHLKVPGVKVLRSLKGLEAPVNEKLGLVEIYSGLAGARQACNLTACQPAVHVMIETNRNSERAAGMAWPRGHRWGNVQEVDEERVKSLLPYGLSVELWNIGGGFPCLEYTALKAEREGHQKDWLVLEIQRVAALFQKVFPNARVKRFYENVFSMPNTELSWINDQICRPTLGLDCLYLFRINGSDMSPTARDRLYWLDLNPHTLTNEDCVVVESDEVYGDRSKMRIYEVKLKCKHPPRESWLNAGSKMVDPDAVLPTCVKSMKRRKPPVQPAGIEQCDDTAIQRWRDDEFRFPPYQYQDRYLIQDVEGILATPDADERERLLMYPVGISKEVLSSKDRSDKAKYEDARLCGLGEGFHCGVVAWLLNKAMVRWGVEEKTWKAQDIIDEFYAQPLQEMSLLPECRHSVELDMARALVAYQCHVGGELRSVPGREFGLKSWPRHGVPADQWWKWATVLSFPWTNLESINLLEARALLHTLRWRARTQYFVGSRCIHLLDSQVVLGAMRKFRSPSPNLNRVITRCASVILAAGAKVVLIYVPTEVNPADVPSRAIKSWRSQGLLGEQ